MNMKRSFNLKTYIFFSYENLTKNLIVSLEIIKIVIRSYEKTNIIFK